MKEIPKPVVLIVLDGFGVALAGRGNAVHSARKPNFDSIEQWFPFTALHASGVAVGLPWGEAGNSEVGHLTMGAGRVIYHHLPRIIVSIHDGSFYQNPAFQEVVGHVKTHGSSLHLFGLVSSGSVHSYIDHLEALLELASRAALPRVFLHIITDGKDAPPEESRRFIEKLEERIRARHPAATIASIVGRFFAMDRDLHWDRIARAYELLTQGRGRIFRDPVEYLSQSYAQGTTDEFIEPAWREESEEQGSRIQADDGLIIFNFREDSVREITEAFASDVFDGFPRKKIENLKIATMTEYEKGLPNVASAFPPLEISWPLARVLAANQKTQLRIAESEKYAHVTYFFNGGVEKPFPGEDRMLIPSSSGPHFDDHPEMKAPEITSRIIERLGAYDFILANFANADMVGHTGNFAAAVRAVEALDGCVGRLQEAVLARNGVLIITGDHGNVEQKIHPFSGEAVTEHTTNPVPFYLIGKGFERARPLDRASVLEAKAAVDGILTDVAPTILELMQLPKPAEMTGKSLLASLTKSPVPA
ncbi:MAG: 2,3-bisphosphoglycerate-independent phosphoglycerate mutase [Candidatus Sungbacteria bacterium]|uniref:2,3-bisphosphoglycerate-independent phosphoglycerate mutase n=1 Tax=Candidatus Sungiibacteriota bacterium TaxID=2750080 RepID=A0A933DTL3_9BACT|nr:2,3-bisphosphoglycerate-independent phosphoglycerate mutase [Candidatus Sungbacteria bacterium]